MSQSHTHPLEDRISEVEYFTRQGRHGAAAYRRAVKATTGSLPTWAQPKKPGPRIKATRSRSHSFLPHASGDA